MENLEIYEKVRAVPSTALKEIKAGRLKGKSDINPVWRIKTLTEQFGPCGIGWKYTIENQWLESCSTGEIAAFVLISLYIKYNGAWSEAIPGTGGSSFVTKERNGLYLSDECYKMALTDAISVACKALGVGADVYWDKDTSKYDASHKNPSAAPAMQPQTPMFSCADCGQPILAYKGKDGVEHGVRELVAGTQKAYGRALCTPCAKREKHGNQQRAV